MDIQEVVFCHTHGLVHDPAFAVIADMTGCVQDTWTVIGADAEITDTRYRPRSSREHMIAAGVLAFMHTTSGLVPCRVDSVDEEGGVLVTMTAARTGWSRGEQTYLANPHVSMLGRSQVVGLRRERVCPHEVVDHYTVTGTLRLRTDNGRVI